MKKRHIELQKNKILKLRNVLIREVEETEFENIDKTLTMMNHYIKSKGGKTVGPLIQLVEPITDKDGKSSARIALLKQTKDMIVRVDQPYKSYEEIKIINCIYARFVGEKNKMNLAYEKIKVYAFEEYIELSGVTYSIILKDDNELIMDVFAETT